MDLVLRNGNIIDGTGRPQFKGDVAIKDGRIAAVGIVDEIGGREIDLGGATVSPGFIDVHTHYDAQAFWDPMLSPSVYHGVTTVIGGNCGFTLAPLSGKAEDSDYLLRMLSKVEGMPLSVLRKSLRPDWKSFGGFLDRLDGTLAINAIFLVGHSALRRAVMGERAVGHEAMDQEIDQMCALLADSLGEGGAGFSTTVSVAHSDYEGKPVPSRWASREELLRLAAVVGDYPGTWVEMVNGKLDMQVQDYALMADLSLAAGRPVNWNLITIDSNKPGQRESQLRASDYARERGAAVYGLVPAVPPKVILNFKTGMVIDVIPNWAGLLALPHEAKREALSDPAVREALKDGAGRMEASFLQQMFEDWGAIELVAVGCERNKAWMGRRLGEYARAKGKEPLDALFDLAIEEDLDLSFSPPPAGEDDAAWQMRADTWRDARAIIGGSDAGAHLDMINTFAFSTQLLGEGVRTRKLLSLEEAVYRITGLPAARFGLEARGRVESGMAGDIVVFSPEMIDCGPIALRNDLPEGEARLYADAIGIHYVIVNGQIVVENGRATGKIPGCVLRSGRDTTTVELASVR